MAVEKISDIREDLIKQLEAMGGKTSTYIGRVNDYCNIEKKQRKISAAYDKLKPDDPNAQKLVNAYLACDKQKDNILREFGIKPGLVDNGEDKL